MCLPSQQDLILPRGRDADQVTKTMVATRGQVQTEIDTILRDAEQRRLKRSEQERQMHDAT